MAKFSALKQEQDRCVAHLPQRFQVRHALAHADDMLQAKGAAQGPHGAGIGADERHQRILRQIAAIEAGAKRFEERLGVAVAPRREADVGDREPS